MHSTGLPGLSAAPRPYLGVTDQFQTLVIYWGGEKELLCTPIPEGLSPSKGKGTPFSQGRWGAAGAFWWVFVLMCKRETITRCLGDFTPHCPGPDGARERAVSPGGSCDSRRDSGPRGRRADTRTSESVGAPGSCRPRKSKCLESAEGGAGLDGAGQAVLSRRATRPQSLDDGSGPRQGAGACRGRSPTLGGKVGPQVGARRCGLGPKLQVRFTPTPPGGFSGPVC